MAHMSEQLLIAEVQSRLTSKFAQIPPDEIAIAVQAAHGRFEQSRIRDFVPLLVERHVRAQLAKLGESVPQVAAAV